MAERSPITIWWTDVVPTMDGLGTLMADLDPLEQGQADRYRFDRDRLRFVWRRALRRRLLADAIGQPARALRFTTECVHCGDLIHGKPRLAAVGNLNFSAAQAGSITALALARAPCGLDVVDATRDPSFIVGNALTPGETQGLPADEPARSHALALLWARKEACLKACGLGLAVEPAELDVAGPGLTHGVPSLVSTPLVGEYWLASWLRPEGWALALAWQARRQTATEVEIRRIPD
jgi:4'-phosphopantetheinyl transferase